MAEGSGSRQRAWMILAKIVKDVGLPLGNGADRGFDGGKTSPSAKYLQRAEMLARAVDIVAAVRASAPGADHLIQFGQQLKDLVHRPPQTLAGLRHLEASAA